MMTVQIALILWPPLTNHALKGTKKKGNKMTANVITRGGNADWILQTNAHLQSEPHLRKPVKCFSCSQKSVFLQVSQQGLILSTSNSDASCDESLM